MKTLLRLGLALLLNASACMSESTRGKSVPPMITLPNPGIVVNLRVEVQDTTRVLAHLRLTNRTADTLQLYKPLVGEGPVWERIFYVIHDSPERVDLPYLGPHAEQYVGGRPHTLIFVIPTTNPTAWLPLAPGATHEVTKNLSEVFDFTRNRGTFLLAYSSFMPAMQQGRQRFEADSLDPNYPRPVYYEVGLVDTNAPDSVFYRKFTVQ